VSAPSGRGRLTARGAAAASLLLRRTDRARRPAGLDGEPSARVHEAILGGSKARSAAPEVEHYLALHVAPLVIVVMERRIGQAVAEELELGADGLPGTLVACERDAFAVLERPRLPVHLHGHRRIAA